VPDLKNALSLAGYTNFIILANLNEKHLEKIEQKFKKQMDRDLLPGYSDTILALSAELKAYGISNLAALAAGNTETDCASSESEPAPKYRKSIKSELECEAAKITPSIDLLKKSIAEQVKRMQLIDNCEAANIIIYQMSEAEGGAFAVQCPLCPASKN
jgi:hypothetical protein